VCSAGLLRVVRGAARTFKPAFLQQGVLLGVTPRAGSRSALSGTASAKAAAALDEAAPTTGHVLMMSLWIRVGVSRV
jgi:hypothetical protein